MKREYKNLLITSVCVLVLSCVCLGLSIQANPRKSFFTQTIVSVLNDNKYSDKIYTMYPTIYTMEKGNRVYNYSVMYHNRTEKTQRIQAVINAYPLRSNKNTECLILPRGGTGIVEFELTVPNNIEVGEYLVEVESYYDIEE